MSEDFYNSLKPAPKVVSESTLDYFFANDPILAAELNRSWKGGLYGVLSS